jgi:hypothetical protein
LLRFLAPLGSLPWMSHMAPRDHIAITSGNKSTTESKTFVPELPRCPGDLCHAA